MSKQLSIFVLALTLIIAAVVLVALFAPSQEQPRPTSQLLTSTPTPISQAKAIPTTAPSSTPHPPKASPTNTIHPSPTNTPIATTLAEYVSQSEGIAEVTVTFAYTDGAKVRVDKWLKVLTLPEDNYLLPPYIVNEQFLSVGASTLQNGKPAFEAGQHYVIFIDVDILHGECHPRSFGLLNDIQGIYRIADGNITQAPLPQYNGIALAQLESLLLAQLPASAQLQPTVMPDVGPDELVQLVHSADLIVEAHLIYGDSQSMTYEIDKVLNQNMSASETPVAKANELVIVHFRCDARADGGETGRYIIFAQQYKGRDILNLATSLAFFSIDNKTLIGGGMFTVRPNPDPVVWTDGSLDHFAGWPLADLESAVADAINTPYVPATPALP